MPVVGARLGGAADLAVGVHQRTDRAAGVVISQTRLTTILTTKDE